MTEIKYRIRLFSLFFLLLVSSVLYTCKKKETTPKPPQVPISCDHDMDESAISGWTKIFEENFDSDLSNWNTWTGGAYNNELQCYQEDNLILSNGILKIETKRESVTGPTNPSNTNLKNFSFTSGRIESKVMYSPDITTPKLRFSARIKLPKGTGMWPAFWTYGNQWPTNGEIDILEARGNLQNEYSTNYFYGTQSGINLVQGADKKINTDNNLADCWHVYELIWEQERLTFYLNDVVVDTKLSGTGSGQYIPELFEKNQRITLNVAVGGDYFWNLNQNNIETGFMEVDWVRVYKANP